MSLEQEIQSELDRRGIDKAVSVDRPFSNSDDPRVRFGAGILFPSYDDPERIADDIVRSLPGADETAESLGSVPLASDGEIPSPKALSEFAADFSDARFLLDSDRTRVVDSGGTRSLSFYQTEDRSELIGSVAVADEGSRVLDFARALVDARPAVLETLSADVFSVDRSVQEQQSDARARRQNREAAREAAESADVDLNEFGTDARADGTIVLQDRDTGRTRTIDPDEDLGDAIDQQTDGGSFEPTSSSSNDARSPRPSVDDLGGGRLAAIAAIGAAILYGVTQS